MLKLFEQSRIVFLIKQVKWEKKINLCTLTFSVYLYKSFQGFFLLLPEKFLTDSLIDLCLALFYLVDRLLCCVRSLKCFKLLYPLVLTEEKVSG